MSPKDLLSALIVILAWGVNFVVIKVGLHGVPPMLLGALRFALVAFPAVFFVKRPAIPFGWLFAYGATSRSGNSCCFSTQCPLACPRALRRWCCRRRRFSR